MNEVTTGPSEAIISTMSELWRLRPPARDNILAHPAFQRLSAACRDGYHNAGESGPKFALLNALQALGLPCSLRKEITHLSLPVDVAARRLDAAMRATRAKRIHLAPLDLAADLPSIVFSSARVCRLTPDELRSLVDEPRLKRLYPLQDFDAERFSNFHWLVVEETVALEDEPEARAIPVLFRKLSEDLGEIKPHEGRFPVAIEEALFFLLLAPWENWSKIPEFDWRGFRIPWVYTVDSDIFVDLSTPPSPDSLSWEPCLDHDCFGRTFEHEQPIKLQLNEDVATLLPKWNQSYWDIVEQAKESALFQTPIVHFLVRAFLSDGIDEFLAHITMIESALGMHADYKKDLRVEPDRHKNLKATDKMKKRVAGLLGDYCYADQYEQLFDLRCAFLHGRTMKTISTQERVMARSLARKVVQGLICATRSSPIPIRESFLDSLLDEGMRLRAQA